MKLKKKQMEKPAFTDMETTKFNRVKNKMRYNKPPTTKSMCTAHVSLATIRKTVLLLSQKDNKQSINSIDRIYPVDVNTQFKANIWSKKMSQGKISAVQHIDKSVSTPNHANTGHEVCSEISLSLLQVVTNSDNLNQLNMPVTRQQLLKSRKLYNLDDALISHDVNVGNSTLAASLLKNVVVSNSNVKNLSRNAEKAFESMDFQQGGYSVTSSSPERAVVQTVVEALIEPLPEDKGKHNKYLQKTNKIKKVANINEEKKCTEINVDAIEIIKPTNSRVYEKPQTSGISLPWTLTELNKNVDLNETEITTSNGNKKRPNVIKRLTKPVNKNKVKSVLKDSQMSSGKENINTYLVNNNIEIPQKKKAVRKKGRTYAQSKKKPKTTRKKTQRKILESSSSNELHSSTTGEKVNERLANVTKRTTKRISTHDDFNLVFSSSPKVSATITTAKNRRTSYKTHSFSKRISYKSFSKNYHPDCAVRQNTHDGYESLYSDNEAVTTKKIKCEISRSPITKLSIPKQAVRPLSFKPVFMSCNKLECSSSSSLPDLEIEMDMPPNAAVIERLSSLSSLFEDNLPAPNTTSARPTVLSSTNLTEQVVDNDKAEVASHISDDETHCCYDLECFHNSPTADGKCRDDSLCSCILSSDAKEIHVEHSREAIMSWVATGQASDSVEVFKSIVEAVLSGYADINRAYLEALKGPVHPSLTNLYEILVKHDHDLNNYFNKK